MGTDERLDETTYRWVRRFHPYPYNADPGTLNHDVVRFNIAAQRLVHETVRPFVLWLARRLPRG